MGWIVGIDVGLKGAIAYVSSSGDSIDVVDMPTNVEQKGKRKENCYDPLDVIEIFRENKPSLVMLESQHAMPKQGVVSMFKLGYGFGLLVGILFASAIPFEFVHPKTWQKEFGIGGGDTKMQSYKIASALFPTADLKGKRGGKKDGRSDAILIAEYGRRRLQGGNDA